MKYLFLFCFCLMSSLLFSQTEMPLYEGPIPNSKDVPNVETSEVRPDGILIISKVTVPTLAAYLPSKETATGKAIIICPGGGYWLLAAGHEGHDVAKEFAKKGVAAFVLKYRLPNGLAMEDKSIGPLQDAQRAIQMVRENAAKWNIKPDQIGIMGFSAGGHLASTAGTHFKREVIENPKKTSLRPDFMVLVYPVITFDKEVGHSGSSKNLIGERPPQGMIDLYSNDKQVTAETPPTYLVHAKDDPVKIENSYLFEAALKQNNVPVAHTYFEKGGHGYGMINPTSEVRWMDDVEKWMKAL
ncbi:alpha/beta hydrolase [Aquiflexum gelatinilyticum]|uniref:alpha/beta hydrolase n=1 Tax=Aquiflexum gelatinilyticum TaxID=2961943 RepID=UPI002169C149|nr:alpha/beta hydrolase [Aquiflexum gelatinilyticum]MCS4436046.1 alpha/beta hydrolase [Aquiflexum gelatinilyticum]